MSRFLHITWREFGKEISLLLIFGALWAGFAISTYGCTAAQVLQNLKTVNDVAKNLCLITGQEKTGLSVEEVAKEFCNTREQLAPWIGVVKEAQATGAIQTGMTQCQPKPGVKCL